MIFFVLNDDKYYIDVPNNRIFKLDSDNTLTQFPRSIEVSQNEPIQIENNTFFSTLEIKIEFFDQILKYGRIITKRVPSKN